MQALVLGMHRSGTSMVTHLLKLAGCHLGSSTELMEAMPDNPGGYWERTDICALNSLALHCAGVEWNTTTGREIAEIGPGDRGRIAAAIRDTIKLLDAQQPWAIKDPRLSVVLPLWKPLLSNPIAVICVRHPLEVAYSLKGRDGTPLGVGLALWEVYTRAALESSRSMPRVVVSHRQMLASPVAATSRLVESMNEQCDSSLSIPSGDEIRSVVQKKFHRSKASNDSRDDTLPPYLVRFLDAIEEGHDLAHEGLDALSPVAHDEVVYYREVERLRKARPEDSGLPSSADSSQVKVDQLARLLAQETSVKEKTLKELIELYDKHAEMGSSYDHLAGEYRRVVDLLGERDREKHSLVEALAAVQSELTTSERKLAEAEAERDDLRQSVKQAVEQIRATRSRIEEEQVWRQAFESRPFVKLYRTLQRALSRSRGSSSDPAGPPGQSSSAR